MPTLAGKAASFEVTAQEAEPRRRCRRWTTSWRRSWGSTIWRACARAITERIQSEYDQLARLRLKRQLLDALAEVTRFASPEGMVEQEFGQIWQRLEAERQAGRLDEDDKDKDEETLKADYRAIAERRVRLGLLLAEIGRANSITVAPEEMTRAMRAEAMRYPGQEQQVFEFFRQNPQAADTLRGPMFEEKVIDFILELAKVEEKTVTLEELAKEPPAAAAAPAVAVGACRDNPAPGPSGGGGDP